MNLFVAIRLFVWRLIISFMVFVVLDIIMASLVFSIFVCLPHLKCGGCVAGEPKLEIDKSPTRELGRFNFEFYSQYSKILHSKINPLRGNWDVSILNFMPCV